MRRHSRRRSNRSLRYLHGLEKRVVVVVELNGIEIIYQLQADIACRHDEEHLIALLLDFHRNIAGYKILFPSRSSGKGNCIARHFVRYVIGRRFEFIIEPDYIYIITIGSLSADRIIEAQAVFAARRVAVLREHALVGKLVSVFRFLGCDSTLRESIPYRIALVLILDSESAGMGPLEMSDNLEILTIVNIVLRYNNKTLLHYRQVHINTVVVE